jgi:hypothetical protein
MDTLIIIIIMYNDCKWEFTQGQCYMNMTQHTNNILEHLHITLKQNAAQKATETIKDTMYNANTIRNIK